MNAQLPIAVVQCATVYGIVKIFGIRTVDRDNRLISEIHPIPRCNRYFRNLFRFVKNFFRKYFGDMVASDNQADIQPFIALVTEHFFDNAFCHALCFRPFSDAYQHLGTAFGILHLIGGNINVRPHALIVRRYNRKIFLQFKCTDYRFIRVRDDPYYLPFVLAGL